MAIEPTVAMLDHAASQDVARLVVAELTPAAPTKSPRIRKLRGDLGSKSGKDIEVESAGGTTRITERDLSRAIEAVFEKRFGQGDVVVLRGGGFRRDAVVLRKIVARLPSLVEARRRTLTEKNIEALVDAFLPADAVAPAMPDVEADNARAQAAFLQTYPTLTADEVAERAGHNASNRSATANRWKADHKIFAIRAHGREVYPAFQFKEGQPRPSLRSALKALSCRTGWQTAFWFITPNSWLGGPVPIERLEDGEALSAAAGQEIEDWAG